MSIYIILPDIIFYCLIAIFTCIQCKQQKEPPPAVKIVKMPTAESITQPITAAKKMEEPGEKKPAGPVDTKPKVVDAVTAAAAAKPVAKPEAKSVVKPPAGVPGPAHAGAAVAQNKDTRTKTTEEKKGTTEKSAEYEDMDPNKKSKESMKPSAEKIKSKKSKMSVKKSKEKSKEKPEDKKKSEKMISQTQEDPSHKEKSRKKEESKKKMEKSKETLKEPKNISKKSSKRSKEKIIKEESKENEEKKTEEVKEPVEKESKTKTEKTDKEVEGTAGNLEFLKNVDVSPAGITWQTEKGNNILKITNKSGKAIVFKIKSSNNQLYTVLPVHGKIENGAYVHINVTRKAGKFQNDKLNVLVTEAQAGTSPEEQFKKPEIEKATRKIAVLMTEKK